MQRPYANYMEEILEVFYTMTLLQNSLIIMLLKQLMQ